MAAPLGTPPEPAVIVTAAGTAADLPSHVASFSDTTPAVVAGSADSQLPSDALPPLPTSGELAREAPAWLASAIIHMLLMIVLGLMVIAQPIAERFVLSLSPDEAGEDLSSGDLDMPFDLDEPTLDEASSFQAQPLDVVDASDMLTSLPTPVASLGAVSAASADPIRLALSGREAGMKDGLRRAYGGTAGTQLAVEEALKWLARYQDRKTSLWNLDGPFADGATPNNRDAATALALIAFQGDGHTPAGDPQNPFTRVTARAWNAFLKRQDDEGNFFQEGAAHGRLYTHAMATIALCELYGMTRDEQYREPAQRAIDYCVKIQAAEGGWRYFPGTDSDLSVTGWFVMALQSARMAGLDVPAATLDRVRGYLDLVSHDGGAQYAYTARDGQKLSMTAEGLLCRQYLGWTHDKSPLLRGVNLLTRNLPQWVENERDCYYWYYGSQVCHHMEGEPWQKWNGAMRELLPNHQVREGRERGSWDPKGDRWGAQGGRLFVTCLHTFMLEVYYRHLPIYQMRLLTEGSDGDSMAW
ncbi:MAG: hypothetical protein KDA44_01740 [Planctomycetales bacterium]|nr:hypothetical protein [Planctomycetales bacterium]